MRVLSLALAAACMATCANAQTEEDEAQIGKVWDEVGVGLEVSGISKPMYRQYHYWLNGQYILGVCEPFLRDADVLFWRTWWKNTPFEQSASGRSLLLVAADSFNEGVADRLKSPLPRNRCTSVTMEWVSEMKRVAAEKF